MACFVWFDSLEGLDVLEDFLNGLGSFLKKFFDFLGLG